MSETTHHPVWKVLSNLTMLGIVLVFTATDFDASELQTLGLFLAGSAGIERLLR